MKKQVKSIFTLTRARSEILRLQLKSSILM